MALSHSPKVVTDGLVFYYDQGNTDKSWRGAPTSNVIETDLSLYTSDNGCTITLQPYTFQGQPVYRVVFPGGTLPRIRTNFSYTSGQQFSGSIYYRVVAAGGSTVALYFRESGFGTVHASTALTSLEWARASVSNTFSSSGTSMFLLYRSDTNALPNVIDFCMPQTELGSFATPFVAGTRSTTQSLLDLTRRNTITANSLTYASDGSFSFGGSDRLNLTISGSATSTEYTRIVWIKPTESTADMKSVMLNQIGNNSDMAVGIQDNRAAFHQYTRTGTSGTTDGDYTASGSTTLSTNNIYMIAVTVNRNISTNNINIYLNGLLDGTASLALGAASSDGVIIGGPLVDGYGGARMFYGDCYAAAHYDKALTAAEIQQNFNAHRGRYGI